MAESSIDQAYQDMIAAWRAYKESSLRDENGWLTLVGLCWLHEGENRVGSAPDGEVVLPASAPQHFGIIHFQDGTGWFEGTAEGAPERLPLLCDEEAGGPTLVTVGTTTFFLIRRDGQIAVRVRDSDSPARRNFAGRAWFPVDPALRLTARYAAHPSERQIDVESSAGRLTRLTNPGVVHFLLAGQERALQAFAAGQGELWFIFRDATSGVSTYPAGRFLYAAVSEDGTVALDFNFAYHPPCAFTHFATCPYPPPENNLPDAIEVGECYPGRRYRDGQYFVSD